MNYYNLILFIILIMYFYINRYCERNIISEKIINYDERINDFIISSINHGKAPNKINLKKNIDSSKKMADSTDTAGIENNEILNVLFEMFNVLNSNIQSVGDDIAKLKYSISQMEKKIEKLSAGHQSNYFETEVIPFDNNSLYMNKNIPIFNQNRNIPKSISEMVNKVYDLRVTADYRQFLDFDRQERQLVLSNKVNPAKEAEYITEAFIEGDAVYINRIAFFNSSDVSTALFDIKQSGLLKGDIQFFPCFIRKDGIIEKGRIG